jgi:AbiV family abortive infection protein
MYSSIFLEWSQKAASNSAQLAVEARILFDANHTTRAYYLAHMSTEESSKSILLHSMHKRSTPISELSKIVLLLRNHKKKIEFIVSYAASESQTFKSELSNLGTELIAHINNLKNDSMYVSCKDGKVISPEDKIASIDVAIHLDVAESLVNVANNLLTHHSNKTPNSAP